MQHEVAESDARHNLLQLRVDRVRQHEVVPRRARRDPQSQAFQAACILRPRAGREELVVDRLAGSISLALRSNASAYRLFGGKPERQVFCEGGGKIGRVEYEGYLLGPSWVPAAAADEDHGGVGFCERADRGRTPFSQHFNRPRNDRLTGKTGTPADRDGDKVRPVPRAAVAPALAEAPSPEASADAGVP